MLDQIPDMVGMLTSALRAHAYSIDQQRGEYFNPMGCSTIRASLEDTVNALEDAVLQTAQFVNGTIVPAHAVL